jgi:hypothetical protein
MCPDFQGDCDGILLTVYQWQKQHELIAINASHRIRFTHGLAHANTGLLRHPVARLVAKTVVHGFEIIQINKHLRQARLLTPRRRQGLLEAVSEQGAIGKTRERVVLG